MDLLTPIADSGEERVNGEQGRGDRASISIDAPPFMHETTHLSLTFLFNQDHRHSPFFSPAIFLPGARLSPSSQLLIFFLSSITNNSFIHPQPSLRPCHGQPGPVLSR